MYSLYVHICVVSCVCVAFIANGERTRPGDNAMFGHSDARHVTDLVHGKMAVFSPTQNGRLLNRDILHLQDKLVFPPNVSVRALMTSPMGMFVFVSYKLFGLKFSVDLHFLIGLHH